MTHERAVQLAGLLNLASKNYERQETPFTRALNAERTRAGAIARLPWSVRALLLCARMVWTDVQSQRESDGRPVRLRPLW
jgi:hypothetical protein